MTEYTITKGQLPDKVLTELESGPKTIVEIKKSLNGQDYPMKYKSVHAALSTLMKHGLVKPVKTIRVGTSHIHQFQYGRTKKPRPRYRTAEDYNHRSKIDNATIFTKK